MPTLKRLREQRGMSSGPKGEALLFKADDILGLIHRYVYNVQELLSLSIGNAPVFCDQRSLEILRRAEDDEVVASMATFGEYYVATLARFKVQCTKKYTGETTYLATLLNGFIRLLEKPGDLNDTYKIPLPSNRMIVQYENLYVAVDRESL
ncbi:hypothetical protein NMY22_g13376 [Coprinellus aureogranulatus]|nr:hypothetical protein NMY22_g13376 [Coprinellus aureogranulatus]